MNGEESKEVREFSYFGSSASMGGRDKKDIRYRLDCERFLIPLKN